MSDEKQDQENSVIHITRTTWPKTNLKEIQRLLDSDKDLQDENYINVKRAILYLIGELDEEDPDPAYIDYYLNQIDVGLCGWEIKDQENATALTASPKSIIGKNQSNPKCRTILCHLLALHYKLIPHETKNNRCPLCNEKVKKSDTKCGYCTAKLKPSKRKELSMNLPKFSFKKVLILFLITFLIALSATCVTVIPAGSTGVRVTMGKIDSNLITAGPTFKLPFVQDIKIVNNKQQTYTFPDRVWGESSEQTVVYMENVSVSYQIMPEHSVWLYANVTDYQTNALPPSLMSSAMKAAMIELKTNEVTNRAKIEPIALSKLQEALNTKYNGNEVVHITSVNINNMDFEENYNQAIEQRQIAQLEYEKQQIAIKTQLEKAEADKQEREIKANAEAAEKEIQAEAEAKAIKAVADAQAEANKKLAQSLTKDLVDYQKIEKWDGKLPQVSNGDAIVDLRDSEHTIPAA